MGFRKCVCGGDYSIPHETIDTRSLIKYKKTVNLRFSDALLHPSLTTRKGYSVRRLFAGFANAAFMTSKLIVTSAIVIDASPATRNTHHPIATLYA